MPRGVYEHYDANSYIEFILQGYGLPPDVAYEITYLYIDEDDAEIILEYIAEMQKQETYVGTSETIIDDIVHFTEHKLGGIIGQMLDDISRVGVSRFLVRYDTGFYDKTYNEQLEIERNELM